MFGLRWADPESLAHSQIPVGQWRAYTTTHPAHPTDDVLLRGGIGTVGVEGTPLQGALSLQRANCPVRNNLNRQTVKNIGRLGLITVKRRFQNIYMHASLKSEHIFHLSHEHKKKKRTTRFQGEIISCSRESNFRLRADRG